VSTSSESNVGACAVVKKLRPEEKEVRDWAEALLEYDRMFEIASKLKDQRAMHLIAACRESRSKLHRCLDPDLKRALDEQRLEANRKRDELRLKLRAEEQEQKDVARKRKEADLKKKEASAKARDERDRLERLRLQIDKKWHEKDFGHGLTCSSRGALPDFPKVAKAEISNYREALERLKLRAPALPDHMEAQWDDLVEEFPLIWLEAHQTRFGNASDRIFLEQVGKMMKERSTGIDSNFT
jgi:chromosome segregation ATPase